MHACVPGLGPGPGTECSACLPSSGRRAVCGKNALPARLFYQHQHALPHFTCNQTELRVGCAVPEPTKKELRGAASGRGTGWLSLSRTDRKRAEWHRATSSALALTDPWCELGLKTRKRSKARRTELTYPEPQGPHCAGWERLRGG